MQIDDEVIVKIEDAFSAQSRSIDGFGKSPHQEAWNAQNRDNTVAIARVIHEARPDYDMERFFQNCGFKLPYPRMD